MTDILRLTKPQKARIPLDGVRVAFGDVDKTYICFEASNEGIVNNREKPPP